MVTWFFFKIGPFLLTLRWEFWQQFICPWWLKIKRNTCVFRYGVIHIIKDQQGEAYLLYICHNHSTNDKNSMWIFNFSQLMKWNESGFRPLLSTCIQAKLGQDKLLRMVRWVGWQCPPDTWFEILILEVWGRAHYLSVTEAPHNTEFYGCSVDKEETFLFVSNRRDLRL